MMEQKESTFVTHTACEVCGSKDNAGLYDDGHTYCFGCAHYGKEEFGQTRIIGTSKVIQDLIPGTHTHLSSRKLTEETCRKFDYSVGLMGGKPVQLATYRDKHGQRCAQKVRGRDKSFSIVGNAKAMTLFGSHLWSTGNKLVITEGEIDAMSVSQAQGNKWATVSIPNGAKSARQALMNNYDYLMNFKSIILMFDGDAAGQEAALECAEALPIGVARIANLGPYKDASEALVAGETRVIIDAIFQAREYRPDGIISTSDLRDTIGEQEALSPITYPYSRLNDITKGLRAGSLVTIAAGSGVGKSTFVREIAYHVHQSGFQIGMLMLEENVKRTAQGLVGLHMNKNITVDPECTTREDIETSFDDLVKDRQFYLFDHFGSTDIDVILNRIRYMNKALGAEVIILDHISILVSGLTGQVNDERRLIDDIMNRLRVLVQELNICLIVVSHLRRPQGDTGHEGGAKVSLSQLRGSHAIAQLADCCIGIQVNAEEPSAGIRDLVVLKNRFTGEVGPAGELQYSQETGRLRESTGNFDSLGTSDIPF